MGILPALLLGAVQGVTEFWPISSSAHLALLIHIFGWGEPDLSFMVALHVGTWLAVWLPPRASVHRGGPVAG